MKHKHYYLLLLIVATLLVSCPVNQSSPTPSKPDIVVPDEPQAPTTDVEGNVEEPEITAWKDALSALVHYSGTGVDQGEDQEIRSLRKFLADTNVEIEDTSNIISVTYNKGSYTSGATNINNNKSTGILEISGKYNDSGKSFKVYVNGSFEYHEAGSSTFTGTATYTEGSTTSKFDVNKASGGQIEDENSPEYKAGLIINGMHYAEYGVNETKTAFTNYNYPSGYIFDGKTVGVEVTDNTDIYDQEKTDETVSVTLQGDVKLIVRYDIKREGATKTITDSSYMHVKRVGEEKFKVFPTNQLTL